MQTQLYRGDEDVRSGRQRSQVPQVQEVERRGTQRDEHLVPEPKASTATLWDKS